MSRRSATNFGVISHNQETSCSIFTMFRAPTTDDKSPDPMMSLTEHLVTSFDTQTRARNPQMTPDDEDDDDDGRQDASHYSPSRHSVNRCIRSHLADAFTRDARDAWHTVAAGNGRQRQQRCHDALSRDTYLLPSCRLSRTICKNRVAER